MISYKEAEVLAINSLLKNANIGHLKARGEYDKYNRLNIKMIRTRAKFKADLEAFVSDSGLIEDEEVKKDIMGYFARIEYYIFY